MALPVAALTKDQLPTNPFPLGLVAPAAAGTAVKITKNFTDLDNRPVHWVQFRANDANTGLVYVVLPNLSLNPGFPPSPPWTLPGGGATVTGADKTNFLNVIQVLSAGETWSVPSWMMNMIRLGQFWIDADNNGEGAIVVIGEA